MLAQLQAVALCNTLCRCSQSITYRVCIRDNSYNICSKPLAQDIKTIHPCTDQPCMQNKITTEGPEGEDGGAMAGMHELLQREEVNQIMLRADVSTAGQTACCGYCGGPPSRHDQLHLAPNTHPVGSTSYCLVDGTQHLLRSSYIVKLLTPLRLSQPHYLLCTVHKQCSRVLYWMLYCHLTQYLSQVTANAMSACNKRCGDSMQHAAVFEMHKLSSTGTMCPVILLHLNQHW